jgi:hypothetical protein
MFSFADTATFDRFLGHVTMSVVTFLYFHPPLKVLLGRAYTETEGFVAVLTTCSGTVVFFFTVWAGFHSASSTYSQLIISPRNIGVDLLPLF